ncbi:serine/threonine-protein kinase [Streptomyces sp. NPDC058045]|uniref:serine/threonine-protein kinase n=1 Tax=Streptomyces sp. NPDC058045 TaxID=3346311 RepID=UPI0036F078D2
MGRLGPDDPPYVGAYRLLARLGAGGMGQVYLARSARGRIVAVKLVREELAAVQEFRDRFRLEVAAALQVGGEWTAPVLDADTDTAVPWVATGYVAGPSLQQVVGHDHGPLPERSVRILAAGLARALTDIHTAGLVHRDLKPSNVLLTIDGPRVIDFGIARALETIADGGMTRTGALVGSPGFMAPEQVRGERITPAADIFCLGSVLAFAATGRLPFGSDTSGVHALMFRIAQEPPNLDGIPEGLSELIADCLEKDPVARPALADILRRTGAEDTVGDGRAHEPWLPGALVAQLGRHAVQLLNTESPDEAPDAPPAPGASDPTATPSGTPGSGTPADPDGSGPDDSANPPAPGTPGQGDHTVTGSRSSGSLNHLPTMLGTSPTPPSPPSPPSTGAPYGGAPHAGPHPSAAYGYPQHSGPSVTPPYGPSSPYGTGGTGPYGMPGPQPRRRTPRSTVALVVVAVVVALGAGGSVYSAMKNAGAHGKGGSSNGGSGSGGSGGSGGGKVPDRFLGTWKSGLDTASGHSSRTVVIKQGSVGDTVLALTADGPTADGSGYHCIFHADLDRAPSGGSVHLGPSTVTTGPSASCSPGAATTLTILSDGRLQRVNDKTGEKLTYSKDD